MKAMTIEEVIEATSGTLLKGNPSDEITNVVFDSREVGEGTLFVPIIGERVDAHKFIPDVMKAGAVATFTSNKDIQLSDGNYILVEDTLAAMQDLAGYYRKQFDIPVIGVTGSVGKTTTKEMISAALGAGYKVHKTAGNSNGQIGLPITLFGIDDETEIAVIEMGMSLPGEMARIVDIARPQTAVLTNVGVSHIGNLGSRANIAKEKGNIVKYLTEYFYICGNGDMIPLTKENVPYDICENDIKTIYYGEDESLDIYASEIEVGENSQSFVYNGKSKVKVTLSVLGSHNINNALVAMALAEQYGVDPTKAAKALSEYKSYDMRGVVKEVDGIRVVDDTYNASPDSVNSNVKMLFDYPGEGRRIAVLADVLELGEQSEELHRGMGSFIAGLAGEGKRLDLVVTYGDMAKYICKQISEECDIPTESFDDHDSVAKYLKDYAKAGDVILVKGSRGMQMDKVVDMICN
ncbi:MAG: UDP-N-acetylmuramoyl-tripeptide--D-alanyl-D-alanine ligase [Eubacterium sp.]|nr:UDP-N-acetylmuramoyl-tripeptide--D-alanyl-D-alanine ligase [Eubacterium sp.]